MASRDTSLQLGATIVALITGVVFGVIGNSTFQGQVGVGAAALGQRGESLTVFGTESGNVLHAEKNLSSSGALKVVGTSTLAGVTVTTFTASSTLSGSTVTAGGGHVFANQNVLNDSGSLTVVGATKVTTLVASSTLSGASTLTLSPLAVAPTFKVLCPKAGGVIGTMTVTATGTVLKVCN